MLGTRKGFLLLPALWVIIGELIVTFAMMGYMLYDMSRGGMPEQQTYREERWN